jgi:hypothetical protein
MTPEVQAAYDRIENELGLHLAVGEKLEQVAKDLSTLLVALRQAARAEAALERIAREAWWGDINGEYSFLDIIDAVLTEGGYTDDWLQARQAER